MSFSTLRFKTFLAKAREILNRPFTQYACYFISILFLIIILDIVSVCKGSSSFTFLFTGTFIAYLVTAIYGLLPHRKYLRGLFNFFIFGFIYIFFIIDFMSLYIYGRALNKDYAAAIVNTNEAEMREFAEMYLSIPSVLAAVGISAVLFFLVYKVNQHGFAMKKKVRYFFYLLLPVCIYIFATCDADKRSILGKMSLILTPQKTPDLAKVGLHPQFTAHRKELPQNVVMIVGESLSKHHCSLYGYPISTNPRLSALRDTAGLMVFKNVTSPETSTEPSLKDVFTTYPEVDNFPGEWYRCVNLFEMMKQVGFKSFWVSNQSKKGLWDNTIGKFADLCDENYFVGNKFAGAKRTSTDDQIFEYLNPLLDKDTLRRRFFTVHLMGSHPAFKTRYPESFARFQPEMYAEYPENQQEKLAEYDNSVLFNDFIVSEIIQRFSDKESLIFYFSDHALDVFQSSATHAGHAKADPVSQKYGKEIPFMIYASPRYQKKYPEKVEMIRNIIETPFNTGYFFYLLKDLLGIRMPDKNLPESCAPLRSYTTNVNLKQ